jgi:hypothetical protein
MSADAWHECPICKKHHIDKINKLKEQLQKAYTEMTAITYDILKQKIEAQITDFEKKIRLSVRIDGLYDYQFDSNGNFSVHITASCTSCKRTWDLQATTKPEEPR